MARFSASAPVLSTSRSSVSDSERNEPAPAGALDAAAEDDLLSSMPGLARIYASAWLHTAEWAVGSSARAGSRVVRAAVSGEGPDELLHDVSEQMRGYARRLLGFVDADGDRFPDSLSDLVASRRGDGRRPDTPESLREQGAELLRRSADVDYPDEAHPAYARILSELAPDEGRILRLLVEGGPQPSIDVRTVGLVITGSELVALGLTMIGAEAGCRHVDRVRAYLNNLFRLGLIWFSREPVGDSLRYQVLEAQPEVLEAMRKAGRGKTVRRSIHLTPFGQDFCSVCLPTETAEFEGLGGDDGDGA
jgi:Abortive infection alpha